MTERRAFVAITAWCALLIGATRAVHVLLDPPRWADYLIVTVGTIAVIAGFRWLDIRTRRAARRSESGG
jgi:hypothetical protein